MRVYLDLVILLNAIVDFFLLLGTNRLTGYYSGSGRCAAAAGLGGLYAGVCLLPGMLFLANQLWRIVSLFMIALIAFGMNKSAIRRGAVFVILCMAMGGIALLIGRNSIRSVVLCGLLTLTLCCLGIRKEGGGIVPVEVSWNGNCEKILALHDTGNMLIDPVTGERVMVADPRLGKSLVGFTEEELRKPVETAASGRFPGVRLVSYQSVGQPGGMLLAMRFHHVKVGGSYQDPLIAFSPNNLTKENEYQMLVGGAL